MDQIYTFNFSDPKACQAINPRTGNPGMLELVCLNRNEGRVFLFHGTLTKAECEQAINAIGPSTYVVAANKYCRGHLVWDGNQSTFTVFCEEEGRGYVRISGCQ